MEVYRAILKRRSIRNFKQRRISPRQLKAMVNAARVAPSAANLQPLEYVVVTAKGLCEQVFKHLKWAGYIAPFGNPRPGCEPVAYIIILVNKKKVSHPIMKRDEKGIRYSFNVDLRDVGAAAENIMLLAQSTGIASCWLGSINRAKIHKIFSIPSHLEIDSVIALGYPKMASKTVRYKGSVKYWLDKRGVLHVPKRPLREVLHWQRF